MSRGGDNEGQHHPQQQHKPSPQDVVIKIGQYNILANCLANNIKPWYWYGYDGLKKEEEDGGALNYRGKQQTEAALRPYKGDGLDHIRRTVFGLGRSKSLIKVWEVLVKQYLKVFSTNGFPYLLHLAETYADKDWSTLADFQEEVTHRALVDFFYRNNMNGFEGDKDLTYHLFKKSNRHFEIWDQITRPINITLTDAALAELEQKSDNLLKLKSSDSKAVLIDQYNHFLRQALLNKPSCTIGEERKALSNLLLPLAKLITLSNHDVKRILEVQSEFSWKTRLPLLIKDIMERQMDVWGIEELDEVPTFIENMKPFKLAVFKQRSINPKEDGCAIFYNPEVWTLSPIKGKLPVSFVRYSATWKAQGNSCQIRTYQLPYKDGFIYSENAKQQIQGSTMINCFSYTDKLEQKYMEYFDERVGVMTVLQHFSGQLVVFACSHLEHSQNDIFREKIRKVQCEQLNEALGLFLKEHGVEDAPVVLACDLNDTVNLSSYLRPPELTPAYGYLTQEQWIDAYHGSCPPTSFTLYRSFTIDFVFYRPNPRSRHQVNTGIVPLVQLAGHDSKGERKLVTEENRISPVYGMPMAAVEHQKALPSDHLPITAVIFLGEEVT